VVGFFGGTNPQLSNHARYSFQYRGLTYKSSEHAYLSEQAISYGLHDLAAIWQLANTVEVYDGERYDASNPKRVKSWSTKAFRAFRIPRHPAARAARKSWEARRVATMFAINMAKGRQSTAFRAGLYATGNAYLVEQSRSDGFWGVGCEPTRQDLQEGPMVHFRRWGENRLGLILMAVRDALRRRATGIKAINRRSTRHKAVLSARHLGSAGGSSCEPSEESIQVMAHFRMQFGKGTWKQQTERSRTAWESTGGRIMPSRRGFPAHRPYLAIRAEVSAAFTRRMMAAENVRRRQQNKKPLTL
jgi:ribA/ribD-fused uncharacterized protein